MSRNRRPYAGTVAVLLAALLVVSFANASPSKAVTQPTFVDLAQPFSTASPVFPGDPSPSVDLAACVNAHPEWSPDCAEPAGYQVEVVTTGTHTGTHISAPAHFFEGKTGINALALKFFTPRPLVVINVRDRIKKELKQNGGDFFIEVSDLQKWEQQNGTIPAGAYVVLYTGLSDFSGPAFQQRGTDHDFNDYFDHVPGFSAEAVKWLINSREALGIGSDTFGPDATFDEDFGATSTALSLGRITIENLGAGVGKMPVMGGMLTVMGPRFVRSPVEKRAGFPEFGGTLVGAVGSYTSK
jgi:kynurenine formamidase